MARSFNGTTDNINCGTPPINSLIDFTYSVWVLGNTWNGATKLFMANGQIGNGSFQWVGWDGAQFTTTMDGSATFSRGSGGATVGLWYHIAATLEASSQNELLYINGVAQGAPQTTQISLLGNLGSNDNFKIGSGVNNNVFFDGSIADPTVWSAKLSAGEIAALAQGIRPRRIRSHSILRWWQLNGLVSPEPDMSGGKFNGTLSGTAFTPGPPITMFTPRVPPFLDPQAPTTPLMSRHFYVQ